MSLRAQGARQHEQQAHASLERLARLVEVQTQAILAPADRALTRGHELFRAGLIDPTDDQQLEQFMHAELIANPDLSAMYLARSDGSCIQVSRTDRGFRSRLIDQRAGPRTTRLIDRDADLHVVRRWSDPTDAFDPRARPWFEQAREQAGRHWTTTTETTPAQPASVTVAEPVKHPYRGEVGVLGAEVGLGALTAALALTPELKSGRIALHGDRGQTIATTDATPREADDHADLRLVSIEQPLRLFDGRLNWNMLAEVPADNRRPTLADLFADHLPALLALLALTGVSAVLAVLSLTRPVVQMHADATTDQLTGALQRIEFHRRLGAMLRHRREADGDDRIAIAVLDLDHFKEINDRFGHAAGDAVLRDFSSRLRSGLRHGDLIGRVGGDEFLLAVRLERDDDPLSAIERLRLLATAKPFESKGGRHFVGATAGIAVYQPNDYVAQAIAHVIARADAALITGKSNRKCRSYLAADGAVKSIQVNEPRQRAMPGLPLLQADPSFVV